jgi:hypothetical protein
MSVHAGSVWIDQNFASLPQDLWVAVDAFRLVGENHDLSLLMSFLATQPVPLSDLTITFIPSGTFQ